jgi:SP family sugar:H+ symporter-like MFS transporter
MTTASNWLLNWAIAYSTPYLVNPGPGNANLGSKVFFIWAFFCLICEYSHFSLSLILLISSGIAFVYFCIYETKGLSLEQVDELYAKCPQAWKSKQFIPSVRFVDIAEEDTSTARRSTLAELEQSAARRKSSVGVHVENEKY